MIFLTSLWKYYWNRASYKNLIFKTVLLAVSSSLSTFCHAQPFVMANLIGQLGNQFFQIAAAANVAIENDANPVFPDLIQKQEFNIPLNYSKVFSHLNVYPQGSLQFNYVEPIFRFSPIPYQPNMCIQGWFQSEKYFVKNKDYILKLFAPSKTIVDYLKSTYEEIFNHPCTVSVHFRSYLREDPYQITHPTQTIEYFEKAFAYFPEDALFIVCSNDIEWCKNSFDHIPRNFVFIEGEPHYHDLYLMSMCKHNIIANSSFSWWSAYLNPNIDKIVTAPRKWFTPSCGTDYTDVIPDGWIAID